LTGKEHSRIGGSFRRRPFTRRARFGLFYYVIPAPLLADFAPIAADLAGT
jgi:hypothetical protein